MGLDLSNKIQDRTDTSYTDVTIRDTNYFPLMVIQNGIIWPYELKKCCKKYKKGNRCKKCPNN
jgi:hypothetical protein